MRRGREGGGRIKVRSRGGTTMLCYWWKGWENNWGMSWKTNDTSITTVPV